MAVDFQRIVFFGDSLTDDGNLPEPARPDPPYVGGRFSNGPVYAEVLPRELGVRTDNVALGGAQAFAGEDPVQQFIGLAAQVQGYLLQQPFSFFPFEPRVEPGTAASIFIGNNDIQNDRPANRAEAADLAGRIVSSISDAVVDLTRAGVGHFLLYTLGNVSDAPANQHRTASARAALDAAVADTNRGIKVLAAQASSLVAVTVVDLNRLETEIKVDRETFGLKVLETPLYNKIGSHLVATGIGSQYSSNAVAFFDPLHPTKAVHAIIGAFSEATLKADHVFLRTGVDDVVVGSAQSELVLSGRGNDTVSGYAGNDVLFSGAGNDWVGGGSGDDLAAGGGGADVVRGKAGSDLIAGNEGSDLLYGGTGSDVMIGGTGGDLMFGQSGHDVFIFTNDGPGNGFDQIFGGSGIDTLRLTVSRSFYDSLAFQTELQEFAAALNTTPGSAFTFDTLDLAVTGIERVEVNVAGKTVYAAGPAALTPSRSLQSLLHDADLWGLV